MATTPGESVYVILIDILRNNTLAGTIQIPPNRSLCTIAEILNFFNVTLDYNVKIWIKREKQNTCRDQNYDRYASLPWEHFNNCVIALAYYRPNPEVFENYIQSLREKKFADALKEQEKIWEEKKRKKEERAGKAPIYVALKNKAIQALKKRKIKARIEAELAEKEKTENKEKK
ncbi:hypothetical protein A2662_02875 [Candidatus Giovannonibacteria bacterium RIFCSPHIGHO2_01_FULL_45_33]|uniref:Uncharacterized protein n=1 Tax=Candidatus Giovannonibacteria bacterium RIFCSPLOWO2_01_FULL_45_34 TaxID=1798351 RepID=A0A1F5X1E5_9BACT|nr:MAG: hypothetical protein A2662_02875 [Candidatus Giovannonibacteria bacterium RIFCSPHIGHO2_01_FULL_45_33]OGF70912.1 MAG: hypothetical protein A3C73_00860 [Candidatus Giovannonibacteria bacterium RIFCSPHIGHO2_02_FULL_44_11]OGF81712.1 MAG: hypothetical protein A2930_03870 [Candidatus Giovannonibacteria bacterium RIFCSPLOWO2_01_FULL_45_34]